VADDKQEITEDMYQGMVFEDGGELVVNLTDVQEMKFENVPKGTYVAEVDEATYGMSNSTGKPMITMKWKIAEGEYEGKTLLQFLSFSPKALSGTKSNLNRVAPELATAPFKPRELCDQGFFLGRKAKIRVDLGEYQGEMRSQIKGLVAYTGESGEFAGAQG
jgi:hypothetical protein